VVPADHVHPTALPPVWLQEETYGYNDIPEPHRREVYVSDFSSRELAGQELDVLPGSWVRGRIRRPGYAHLPWHSSASGPDPQPATSTTWRHIDGQPACGFNRRSDAGEEPALTQSEVETILKGSALEIPPAAPHLGSVTHAGLVHLRVELDGWKPLVPAGPGRRRSGHTP